MEENLKTPVSSLKPGQRVHSNYGWLYVVSVSGKDRTPITVTYIVGNPAFSDKRITENYWPHETVTAI